MQLKPKRLARPKPTPEHYIDNRITLKKLAEHLALSRTTISMILNDLPEATRFPTATRRRVIESAKQLGYRPNYFARSLNRKPTCLIGIIAPDFGNGYEAALLSGFDRRMLNTSYTTFVANHFWSISLLNRHIETLCNRGIEGLLLIDSMPRKPPGIPVVTICIHRSSTWYTRVSIDNALGIEKALCHLSDLGHREIAFFKGPKGNGDTNHRWNAILATCEKLGILVDPHLTVQLERIEKTGMRHADEGRIGVRKLLNSGKRFTALVAYNDISALGAMTELQERGHKVPEDISVIGFDDIEFASLSNPTLTTIRQPLHEMGAIAAELLLRKLANDHHVQDIQVSPELMVRASTCPPRTSKIVPHDRSGSSKAI